MRAALLCALALFCSLHLWAQDPSTSPTAALPEVSGSSSPTPSATSPRLSSPSGSLSTASGELDSIADELETLLSELNNSLAAAGISLDASDQSLESSIRFATSSIDSLAQAKTDLAAAAETARKEAARRSLEAGLWRAGALSATLGLVGALAGPALGAQALPSAGWSAAAGAVGGLVWYLAEHWPPWPVITPSGQRRP
jgi:hypothetical protein